MSNIKNIVKIKKDFPNFSVKKIEEIHKVLSKSKKDKPRLNMIAKGLLKIQVFIPMSFNNLEKFMVLFRKHIANINKVLKNIKSVSKLKAVDSKLFIFLSFQFIFLSILRTRIRITRLCCHTSVTSDDIVTSYEIYKKM